MALYSRLAIFQSTSLLRGTTARVRQIAMDAEFQSTSLLRGTTIDEFRRSDAAAGISIHVPLARDDSTSCSWSISMFLFQSTSLLRGTTRRRRQRRGPQPQFQSTSLLRGTTLGNLFGQTRQAISIHVPLARDDLASSSRECMEALFQSTSLLRGTTYTMGFLAVVDTFQSTSLLRGTTIETILHATDPFISIHVPLARDDGTL